MSLFQKKINGASCPVARARGAPGAFCPTCSIFSKISNNYTTLVVCILLHSRTISYSEPQLGHMKSRRTDE